MEVTVTRLRSVRMPRPSSKVYLLGSGIGGLLLLFAGMALVSPPASLITAGVCTLAATATIAYLRGAK